PYTPLLPLIEGRVKSIYLIGSAAEKISADLKGANLQLAGDLKSAVRAAFARAVSGDVVLLSPACASYDQFDDFEERGRVFKEIVRKLPEAPLLNAPAPSRAVPVAVPRPAQNLPRVHEPPPWAAAESPACPALVPGGPRYIYEAGFEEIETGSETCATPDRADPAHFSTPVSLGPLEPVHESVSPYEVMDNSPATGPASPAQSEEPGRSSLRSPESPGNRVQADLFSAVAPEKRSGKEL
ncbi:MAG: hypothetical protein ACRD10_10060, partial [Terriglobia bacterium]